MVPTTMENGEKGTNTGKESSNCLIRKSRKAYGTLENSNIGYPGMNEV